MTRTGRGAPPPTLAEAGRRKLAALAGHAGQGDEARLLLDDPSPRVRATALAALARAGQAAEGDVVASLSDADPLVRKRACAVAVGFPGVDLAPMLDDPDPLVVETAAWALGERGAAAKASIEALAGVAANSDDPLCREAAVAALGAIGDDAGLPAVLAATSDKAAVRRRAVVALAAFEGPEVEAAIRGALNDRDWQVRQAAEDLLEGGAAGGGGEDGGAGGGG